MISTPFCEHDWKHEARCWYANHPKVMSRLMHQSTLIPASLCTLKASSKASVQATIFTSLHLCWALEIWVDWGLEASTRFSCRGESRSFCITYKHFQSASNLTCNLDKQHIANWFLHFLQHRPAFPVELQVQAFAAHPPAPQLSKCARLPQLSSWYFMMSNLEGILRTFQTPHLSLHSKAGFSFLSISFSLPWQCFSGWLTFSIALICAETPTTVSGLRSTSVSFKSQSVLTRCPELQHQLIRNGAVGIQKVSTTSSDKLSWSLWEVGDILAWSTWSFSRVLSISSFSLHGGCGMSTASVLPTQLKQQRTKQRTSRETAAIAKPLHTLLQQPHSFNEMTCKMQDLLELQWVERSHLD